jgi:hypothetical protein
LAGGVLGLGLALLAAGGLLVAASLAEGDAGGAGPPAAALEALIRRDERVHYELHLTLGRLLSLCPCTRGKANVQFMKAGYHVPEAVRFRRDLTARFPESPRLVGGLLACQEAVRARLHASGQEVAFPSPTGMARGDLDDAVFVGGDGTLNVSQPVRTWPAGARPAGGQPDAGPSAVYTCDARPGPAGGWVVVGLALTA